MPYQYIDHTMNPTPLGHQVSYGPIDHMSQASQARLQQQFNTPKVLGRITQYNASHSAYVAAANANGRPLTIQEQQAQQNHGQAANASINHVIASGTGQHILNRGALEFDDGRTTALLHLGAAVADQPSVARDQARLNVLGGIAQMAAAVGRQQGYSRAIVSERGHDAVTNNAANRRMYGDNLPLAPDARVQQMRDQTLRHTLTAYQGPTAHARFTAYKDVLKMTFDSPGNLRVGDNYGNNIASTGFDMPLRPDNTPTAHGQRLLNAHLAFAPPDLLTPQKLASTVALNNNWVSSSREAPPPPAPGDKRGLSNMSKPPAPGPGSDGGSGASAKRARLVGPGVVF